MLLTVEFSIISRRWEFHIDFFYELRISRISLSINLTVLIDGECDAAVSMPDHIKEKREKATGRRQVM